MSADRSAAQDLAGEEGPSASEGLRQDTRTSNSEMYDNCPTSSGTSGQQSASGSEGIPGIHLRIQQLELETAQPERRQAARARKKLTKDVQRKLSDSGKTDADKIKYLEGVFSHQVTQQARLENQLIPLKKQCDNASKDRDAALDEKARVVELNSKLHELCRELRKENALLLDTSKAISAQELSQRKALTENFQVTVSGITVRLEEHEKDRLHVVNENEILKQKLRALLDQFEARDNHFNQQLQTKELELQMAGMKLQEQSQLVDRAEVQSKKMSDAFQQMQNHKLETDKLLASYNERFSECQQSIEKSNEVFKMLRQDGVRKAALLKQADRDKRTLSKQLQEIQARYDNSSAKLLVLGREMDAVKSKEDPEKLRLRAQNDKLQALCRLLRQEKKDPAATETESRVLSQDADSDAENRIPDSQIAQNGTCKPENALPKQIVLDECTVMSPTDTGGVMQ